MSALSYIEDKFLRNSAEITKNLREDVILLFSHITKNQKELLEIIRNAYRKKTECWPTMLSVEEYNEWSMKSQSHYLHKGFTSIWDGFEVPVCGEVVIEKLNCRDDNKPYLVFESAERFKEFRKNSIILGTAAYSLFEEWITPKLETIAKQYGLTEAAADDVQSEIECHVGIYCNINDDEMSDEHLRSSMCNYMKPIITQRASEVYGKQSSQFVYIDEEEFECLAAEDFESGSVKFEPDYNNIEADIDIDKLMASVLNYIDKISNKNNLGGRFDIKDSLLPQVIKSKNAVHEFLSVYCCDIEKRNALWRPVVLAYQVVYAFENGSKYLKNPAFISACNNVSLQDMINKQMDFADTCKSDNLVKQMGAVSEKLAADNSLSTLLKDCAASDEQIGKSLSKELRTQDALSALSRAVVVAALEQHEMKGEEYYE